MVLSQNCVNMLLYVQESSSVYMYLSLDKKDVPVM